MFKKLTAVFKKLLPLDGRLHFLTCAIIVFSFYPILNSIENAVIVAVVIALAKEYFDILIKRSNTWKQALQDILFDALGIIYAVLFLAYLFTK